MNNKTTPCYCGAPCFKEGDDENQPCWGDIRAIDEEYVEDDYWWIHSCEGHSDMYGGGEYKECDI